MEDNKNETTPSLEVAIPVSTLVSPEASPRDIHSGEEGKHLEEKRPRLSSKSSPISQKLRHGLSDDTERLVVEDGQCSGHIEGQYGDEDRETLVSADEGDASEDAERHSRRVSSPDAEDGRMQDDGRGLGVPTLSALGACPICLEQYKDFCMTKDCLHMFCFTCILSWVHRLHTLPSGDSTPRCPLCKTVISALLVDIHSEYDYDTVKIKQRRDHDDKAPSYDFLCCSQIINTDSIEAISFRKRKRVYLYSYHPIVYHCDEAVAPGSSPPRTQLSVLQPWIDRDLRASLAGAGSFTNNNVEDDVDLSLLRQIISQLISQNKLSTVLGKNELQDSLAPFLTENLAAHFVSELYLFASSRLNISTYDELIIYGRDDG